MSLTEYRRKRQFDKTREPSPEARAPAKKTAKRKAAATPDIHRPIFVVQLLLYGVHELSEARVAPSSDS